MAHTTLKVNGHEFRMSIKGKTEEMKWGGRRYRYDILLECNGEKIRTTYHDSVQNYIFGVEYNENWFKEVLDCIFSDASTVITCGDYKDFAKKFGFDSLSEARRVYNDCYDLCNKLMERFGLSRDEIMKTLEAIGNNE